MSSSTLEDAGASEPKTAKFYPPLIGAVFAKDVFAVKKLLEDGADPYETDYQSRDAFDVVLPMEDSDEILGLLVRAGGLLSNKSSLCDNLLRRVIINRKTPRLSTILQHAAAGDVRYVEEKNSALNLASYIADVRAIRTLLDNGADVNATGIHLNADTPLHALVRDQGWDGELECIDMLLKAGANINAVCGVGGTALHIAARLGKLAIVEKLLAAGADTGFEAEEDGTALQAAVENEQTEVAKALKNAWNQEFESWVRGVEVKKN